MASSKAPKRWNPSTKTGSSSKGRTDGRPWCLLIPASNQIVAAFSPVPSPCGLLHNHLSSLASMYLFVFNVLPSKELLCIFGDVLLRFIFCTFWLPSNQELVVSRSQLFRANRRNQTLIRDSCVQEDLETRPLPDDTPVMGNHRDLEPPRADTVVEEAPYLCSSGSRGEGGGGPMNDPH